MGSCERIVAVFWRELTVKTVSRNEQVQPMIFSHPRKLGSGGTATSPNDIGSLNTRYLRFERNELGLRKEYFSEATVRELGNIFE